MIAGPAGHWYAMEDETLIGLPMSVDDDPEKPPAHPATTGDWGGWYQITDPAPGCDDQAIIAELRA